MILQIIINCEGQNSPVYTNLGPVDLHQFGESVSHSFNLSPLMNSQNLKNLFQMGTPNKQNINNPTVFTDSQCSTYSPIPNQDFYRYLDNKLLSLPNDAYIRQLIALCNDSEDTITWYLNVLADRARERQGCPRGKIVTRRSTARYTKGEKYAEDCHRRYLF